ncbi:response regulator [bacterium]|nr:response regulator [bacterium]
MENKKSSKAQPQALNIAIIDDAGISRKSIEEILVQEGHNIVLSCDSAKSALNSIGAVEIDLYMIDVVMPETSGIELAKLISDQLSGAHIIMMSSLNLEHVIIDSISSGANDFLKKPFSKNDLLLSVGRIASLKNNQ